MWKSTAFVFVVRIYVHLLGEQRSWTIVSYFQMRFIVDIRIVAVRVLFLFLLPLKPDASVCVCV